MNRVWTRLGKIFRWNQNRNQKISVVISSVIDLKRPLHYVTMYSYTGCWFGFVRKCCVFRNTIGYGTLHSFDSYGLPVGKACLCRITIMRMLNASVLLLFLTVLKASKDAKRDIIDIIYVVSVYLSCCTFICDGQHLYSTPWKG